MQTQYDRLKSRGRSPQTRALTVRSGGAALVPVETRQRARLGIGLLAWVGYLQGPVASRIAATCALIGLCGLSFFSGVAFKPPSPSASSTKDGVIRIAPAQKDPSFILETMRLRYQEFAAASAPGIVETAPHASRAQLQELAARVAKEEGIHVDLFDALVRAESDYQIDATSHKGAMSLAQLMPATAAELGLSPDEYYDPEANLRGGARYLKSLLDKTSDVGLALAAYNAGLARVRNRTPSEWPRETRVFVAKILKRTSLSSDVYPGNPSPAFTAGAGRIGAIVSMQAQPRDARPPDGAVTLAAQYAAETDGVTKKGTTP